MLPRCSALSALGLAGNDLPLRAPLADALARRAGPRLDLDLAMNRFEDAALGTGLRTLSLFACGLTGRAALRPDQLLEPTDLAKASVRETQCRGLQCTPKFRGDSDL